MEGQPLVPIVSHHGSSPYKKLHRKKYYADGRVRVIGSKSPDPQLRKRVQEAHDEAAKLGPVKESPVFDIGTFRPLANRVLLKQEFIPVEGGIDIPEGSQKEVPFPAVVVVGGKGCEFGPGDRVIFKQTARKKDVIIGETHYWLAKANQVIARVV